MRIPLFSSASEKKVYRRKGGGGGRSGGGGGSGSGGSRGGSSGSSSGSGGASSGARAPVSIGSGSSSGGKTSAISYGSGGGRVATIPSGQLFSGRSQGGGTRGEVFGSRTYGSGYPGVTGSRGVAGLGFPFFFWPVIWGPAALGGAAYLHSTEYGDANNSSRPGGALTTVPFSSSSGNSTFHIVADNATSTSLLSSVASNCSSVLASNSTGSQVMLAFAPTNRTQPQPEQAVQYFRASSVTLTLDGYNDTAALVEDGGANETHAPLPGWVDTSLLSCLNQTIGAAAPLVDGAPAFLSHPIHGLNALSSMWLIWFLLTTFF
ncbi:hypothetical protein DFH11DRAFT_825417 [Phellopilus nigrolimitatus]|nr:hypothetical protein DFH11DRAFT_825417 [Phellopilus nigrolimitatus]